MEEKIEKALKELLVSHNVVVLPGFGAFVATDMPAMVDAHNNTIYPPRRKVNYDPDHTEDDGLLISYFARQERISKDTATEQISQFVQDINHSLRRGIPWIVEDLGKFIIDGLENLNFFPDPDQNFTPQSYGLPGIEIDPDRPDVITSPVAAEPEVKEQPVKPARQRKRIKAGWLVFILLLLLSGGAYAFLFHTTKGKAVHARLYHMYQEKLGDKKEEGKPEKQVASVAHPIDSAYTASPAIPEKTVEEIKDVPVKPEAEKSESAEKKPVYKPRTTVVAFEKPEPKEIVATELDKFVSQEVEKPVEAPAVPAKKVIAENKVKPSNKEVVKKETAKKEPVKKSVEKTKAASPPKKTVTEEPEPYKKTASITRSPESIYAKYQIVASEHSLIQNAVEASEKYNRMGYNVAVIRFKDGNFGVCLARSNDRMKAEKQLADIRNQVSGQVKLKEY